jgi:hypothetical protein
VWRDSDGLANHGRKVCIKASPVLLAKPMAPWCCRLALVFVVIAQPIHGPFKFGFITSLGH